MKYIKRNKLLVSLVVICLFASLSIYGTYALFTQTVTVNNHIVSGNLDVGLNRISYQEHVIDETTGKMVDKELNTEVIDLKQDGSALFDIKDAVPTSFYEATIQIINNGSVAIDYSAEIIFDQNSLTEQEKELANQIEIIISNETVSKTFKLIDCASNKVDLDTLLKDNDPLTLDAQTFKVRATFIDDLNNNKAQSISVKFDLKVSAIQNVA